MRGTGTSRDRRAKPTIHARSIVERLATDRPPGEARGDILRLHLNENTVGCAPAVVRGLRRRLSAPWLSRYPDYEEGRAILARHFRVKPDELTLTNGVDDAIKLICDTFVEPGDRLLAPQPTFPMYEFFHRLAGGRVSLIRYDAEWQLPAAKVVTALRRRPRWLALANPNNPTGGLVSKKDLRTLLEAAPRTLILVDEAYFDFSGSTVLPWINRFPNLVVARTFSKAYGLAGLRLGLLFANRALTSLMRRAHAVFPVNALALACAVKAVRHQGSVRRYAEMVKANRAYLSRRLEAMGVHCAPSAANFVFARLGERAPELARRLRAQGILVRDWTNDAQLRPYWRITVGTRPEIERLLDALEGL
ncbi:MAG TPA: histidinol-phosphate transaminase [Terriglobia bacterium]|nr:histidinol-phosphate transaminase [Terriglobia bacterium]